MVLTVSNTAFSVVPPSLPLTVPANGKTTVSVRFKPTASGLQSGTVSIAGLTVSLTGAGTTATPVNNPVPAFTSMAPETAAAGGAAFTLNVTGSNFVQGSIVRWNGNPRTTTFVSSTALRLPSPLPISPPPEPRPSLSSIPHPAAAPRRRVPLPLPRSASPLR